MAATYDEIGAGYDGGRRPDARIQARVRRAIGGAKRVVDIGTGTGSFDCSLGVLTAHHWTDLDAGLDEMKRTSPKQVLFIREPFRAEGDFWLLDYFPSIMAVESARRYPTIDDVRRTLTVSEMEDVPVPADCTDGFLGCYWNRPEAFLDPLVRRCISIFAFLTDEDEEAGVDHLRHDLESGRWDAHHGALRRQDEYFVGHRLLSAEYT